MIKKLLAALILGCASLAGAQSHVFPATDTNNTFTGTNTFNNTVTLSGAIAGQTLYGTADPSLTCSPSSVYAGHYFLRTDNGKLFHCDGVLSTWVAISGTGTGSCNIATTGTIGCVKPDGSSITIDLDGTIHASALSTLWSAILNPTGNEALSMGGFSTVFTWGGTTGSGDMFTIQDTTGNTGTGILQHVKTASGSGMTPWQADANGVGWQVANDGSLKGVGGSVHVIKIPGNSSPPSGVANTALLDADAAGNFYVNEGNTGRSQVCTTGNSAAIGCKDNIVTGGTTQALAQFDGLVGAFTDSAGNVIQPIWIGKGPVTLTTPLGATQLQLGVNDSDYSANGGSWTIAVNGVNKTVLGTATPWVHTAGINSAYPTGSVGATAPTIITGLGSNYQAILISYVSGLVTDGAGDPCSGVASSYDSAGESNCFAVGQGATAFFEPGRWTYTAARISPNPMTTAGDLEVGGPNGYPTRLPAGSGYLHWNGSAYVFDTPAGSGGTVSTLSVTTANGVSGVVANPTTTPAITLTLGAITPTSVVPSTPIAHANIAATAVTPGSYTNLNATIAADGSITAASNGSGGGSGYTNLVASATTDTTVAIINGRCTTGQAYLLSTAATLTAGGTINCPVVHSAGGQWSAGSAITVTLGGGLSDLSLAAIPTRVAGTNITLAFTDSTQPHAPIEWWGAVADWNGTTGTDNTTVTNACLTAHPVKCDALYGLYKITSALLVSRSNVGLQGSIMQYITGVGGSGFISTSASADYLDFTGTNQANPIYGNAVDHITFYRSVAATGTAKGISASYTRSLEISNTFVADSVNNLYLLNAQDSHIHDNFIYWANSYSSGTLIGINVDAATNPQSTYLSHNTILAGAQGGTVSFVGLNETGASMNDLWSDQLEVSNANFGVVLDGTSVTVQISGFDIHFTNSILDGEWNSCVKVTNMPAVGNSTVQFNGGECSLQSQAASGTSIGFDSETNTGIVEVSHMQFSQGSHAGFQGWMAAIYAKNSSNFIATDNSIIPVNGFYGIEGDGLTTSTIGNNSIKMLGGISGAKGIYLTGTSTGNTLLGNSITGASGTTGLQFDASATGNIALNTYASVTTPVTDTPGTNRWCDSTACHNFTSLATLPAQAADTTVGNYTGSSAAPTANVMPTCITGASLYNTSTHAWQCVSVGGSGAMINLTGTVTISGACALSGSACVVSTPGNSITFSAIPSGYNKIHIDFTGRFSDAANSEDLGMRFNGDTGNNYRYMVIANNANAPYGPSPTSPSDHIWISSPPAATPAAGFVGNASVDIPVYTGTTFFKTSLSNAIAQMAVTNFFFSGNIYGEWQSTSAITSITLYDLNGGNFVAGTTVVIYGVN